MIKRYYAEKDNTITNAFKSDLTTVGTSSNMGQSDILEAFSIYGQTSSSSGFSSEKSRILIQFPTSQIVSDRNSGALPSSGSVDWYLRIFNAKHGQTLPKDFKLVIAPISQSWNEGLGLDMENYSDTDYSNWVSASSTTSWATPGGDYLTSPRYEQNFSIGTEDLEVNVSGLVESWISGTVNNYGFGIFLTSSQESDTTRSYYTKRFFARGTEFFFKQPLLEARFNSVKKDNRGNFYYSSSLASAKENINTIYLYNRVRGGLRNIPSVGTGNIYVSIFSGSSTPVGSPLVLVADGTNVLSGSPTVVTGGWVSTGVYSASFALTSATTPLETIYDVWHNGNLTNQYFTGSIEPITLNANSVGFSEKYLLKITNLKPVYYTDETESFRLYARPRNWYPNIYTVSQQTPSTTLIYSASYSVFREIDNLVVLPHGTGSATLHTLMSYDVSGNYFNFDMGILEPGYIYAFEISTYNEGTGYWYKHPETFKFRVEKRQSE